MPDDVYRPTYLERQAARAAASAREQQVRERAERAKPPKRNPYDTVIEDLRAGNPAPDSENGRMLQRMLERHAAKEAELQREDEAAEKRLLAKIDPEISSFVAFVEGAPVSDLTDKEFLALAVERAKAGDKSLINEGRRILIAESERVIARSEENARTRAVELAAATEAFEKSQAEYYAAKVKNLEMCDPEGVDDDSVSS